MEWMNKVLNKVRRCTVMSIHDNSRSGSEDVARVLYVVHPCARVREYEESHATANARLILKCVTGLPGLDLCLGFH